MGTSGKGFKKTVCGVFLGIIVLAIGVILCGNAANIWNISVFFPGWWTLFIILPCLFWIITDGPDFLNVVGLIVGVLLLLSRTSFFGKYISWKLILPIAIIALGIKIIISSVRDGKYTYHEKCLFSGKNYDGKIFTGGAFKCSFGKLCIDLSGASISQTEQFVLNCSFGETEIILPPGISLEIKTEISFGEVKNLYPQNVSGIPLCIEIKCSFGSVKITEKK